MTGRREEAVARAWRVVEELAATIGARVAGSEAERRAAELIAEELRARGLAVRLWPFRYVGWEPVGRPRVEVVDAAGNRRALSCAPMAYTDSTRAGGEQGRLVPAGICELVPGLLEWPRFAVERDGRARAFLAVVPDGAARPFPRPERQLLLEPIVIVGSDEFAPIAEQLAAGAALEATVETHGRYVSGRESVNVIAELPGRTDEVVVVSGHYDSVAGTPGAGDNASGVAGCLALAELFSARDLPRTLRFIAWGAHELGLLGSQAYVQELAQRRQLDRIAAALALDILSDGDRLGLWVGPEAFASEVDALVASASTPLPIERFPRGRGETDSWSFAERGIATAMLLTLPYAHFHLPTDTPENNDPRLFAFSVVVAERVVEHVLARPVDRSHAVSS